MAVSKRTRFEVLRRDNHTCRYCGGTAPDVVLTIDHVTPTTLGGTDDPSNLVAACKDCNAGKSSVSPGASLVEDVRAVDLKWNRAMVRVAEARAQQQQKRNAYCDDFYGAWSEWRYGLNRDKKFPIPGNGFVSVSRFYELGVPFEDIRDLVDVALGNERIPPNDKFRYFSGCVWRLITEMQIAAKEIVDAEALEDDQT